MADGILVMSPAEARANAEEMVQIAGELENLLNDVSAEFDKIDNVDTGLYQGSSKAVDLKQDLVNFRKLFDAAYTQIKKSAGDINLIANTIEQQ